MNDKQIKDSYQTLLNFLELNPGKPQNEQRFAQLPSKEILILLKDVCEEAKRRLKDDGKCVCDRGSLVCASGCEKPFFTFKTSIITRTF